VRNLLGALEPRGTRDLFNLYDTWQYRVKTRFFSMSDYGFFSASFSPVCPPSSCAGSVNSSFSSSAAYLAELASGNFPCSGPVAYLKYVTV
jgi:hypothetical protein